MILAPRRIRPNQVFQVFASILNMEYGEKEPISVHVSIIQNNTDYASSVVRFNRPSSRLMQLKVQLFHFIYIYMCLCFTIVHVLLEKYHNNIMLTNPI